MALNLPGAIFAFVHLAIVAEAVYSTDCQRGGCLKSFLNSIWFLEMMWHVLIVPTTLGVGFSALAFWQSNPTSGGVTKRAAVAIRICSGALVAINGLALGYYIYFLIEELLESVRRILL